MPDFSAISKLFGGFSDLLGGLSKGLGSVAGVANSGSNIKDIIGLPAAAPK